MTVDLERKFLHDLAGPLVICRLALMKALEEARAEPPTEFVNRVRGRLEKALDSMKAAEELHAQHRLKIMELAEQGSEAQNLEK